MKNDQNRGLGQTEIILIFKSDLDHRLDPPPKKNFGLSSLLDYTITTDGIFVSQIRKWVLAQLRSDYILRVFWISIWIQDKTSVFSIYLF